MKYFKTLILSALRGLGYDLVPAPGRVSLTASLRNAARNGLAPATIFDVGAASGEFSRLARTIFPNARILMFEPLSEFKPRLQATIAECGNMHLVESAVSYESGSTVFNVHPDLVGSSLLLEHEEGDINGKPRQVALTSLDAQAHEHQISGPFLLKIDVQGAELAVLEGAANVLKQTEFVILELSFFRFFENGPLAHELIDWLGARGFVPYDLLGTSHRPLDGALAQVDCAFVPEQSILRRHHHFATAEQRHSLTLRLSKR